MGENVIMQGTVDKRIHFMTIRVKRMMKDEWYENVNSISFGSGYYYVAGSYKRGTNFCFLMGPYKAKNFLTSSISLHCYIFQEALLHEVTFKTAK